MDIIAVLLLPIVIAAAFGVRTLWPKKSTFADEQFRKSQEHVGHLDKFQA